MYLLIDNYDSFTYNIYQYICELTGKEVRVCRNDSITPEEAEELDLDGIIISPGPGRPEEAGISLEMIGHFAGRVPILGICLGHQSIAGYYGAKIVQAKRIVHGKAEMIEHDGRGLFRSISSPASFVRYHSLAVDGEGLPEELIVTARSKDGEIMGIRHREHIIEGVQFHPESMASDDGKKMIRNFINYRRESFAVKENLKKLIDGKDLIISEAEGFMNELTEGNLSGPVIAAYLTAMSSKGVSPQEIAGCASVLQKKRHPVRVGKPLLDTCGTGGDGSGPFNISSFSALIASACGAYVAKHGNRAVSSKSGSADFYRELGIPVDMEPSEAEELLTKVGFAFLFAPLYHGAMKHAAAVRRELGVKTIMNLLGPLVNPAGAGYQLIGVYAENLCVPMAKAARLLGIKRVMVVHGCDGLDEISVSGPSRIVSIDENGKMEDFFFNPDEHGIPLFDVDELAGGTAKENAVTGRELLSGRGSEAIKTAVLLNAGAGLFVYGLVPSIPVGYNAAEKALKEGRVAAKVKSLQDFFSGVRR